MVEKTGIVLFWDKSQDKVRSGRLMREFEAKNDVSYFALDLGEGELEVIPVEEVILDPEFFPPVRTERLGFKRLQALDRMIGEGPPASLGATERALLREDNEREAQALYREYERRQAEAACYRLASTMFAAGSIAVGICALFVMKDHSFFWGLFGIALSLSGFALASGLQNAASEARAMR